MKNSAKIIKGFLLSTAALVTAFLAIALPFRLLSSIDGVASRTIFIAEITVYFISGMIFLAISDKKKKAKKEEKIKRLERREKFQRAQEEYYDLAA